MLALFFWRYEVKVAVITGASAGIGKRLAFEFAADGINVALVARREEMLEAVRVQILEQYKIQVMVIVADLTADQGPQSVFDSLRDHEVSHLVNNAGFGTNGLFWELDRQKELRQIGLNISALTELTHLFLPQMVKRNSGNILNIASTAAFQPGPNMSVYFATKAYVLSFSEGISSELSGTGVKVTAHCPGATHTEFADVAGVNDKLLFKAGAATVDSVAKHAYLSMSKGKVVAIHGLKNWLLAFSVRFTPRFLIRSLAKVITK